MTSEEEEEVKEKEEGDADAEDPEVAGLNAGEKVGCLEVNEGPGEDCTNYMRRSGGGQTGISLSSSQTGEHLSQSLVKIIIVDRENVESHDAREFLC
jgi:hypothetical protein